MANPVNPVVVITYEQLQKEIAKLPPPVDGRVHVFRRQSRDYGAILSSFGRLRRTQKKSEIFYVFLTDLFIKSGLLTVLGDLLRLPSLSSIDIKVTAADLGPLRQNLRLYYFETFHGFGCAQVAH